MTATDATTSDGPRLLLDAFEAVAIERGVDQVALREVARRAGLSHGAPAHFFGSFAGMKAAFVNQGLEILAAETGAAREAAANRSGIDRLVADGMAFVQYARRHPAHYDAIFRTGAAAEPTTREALAFAMDCLRTLVEEVEAEGDIEIDDPASVTLELWATAQGLVLMWADGQLDLVADEAGVEAVVEGVIRRQAERMAPTRPS